MNKCNCISKVFHNNILKLNRKHQNKTTELEKMIEL